MKQITIVGIDSITDVVFTLEAVDPPITWNVSRLQRAADAGMFGGPVVIPTRNIPAPDWALGGLSRERVDFLKRNQALLDEPTIAIENPPGAPAAILCFVDGQHRVTARVELGLPYVRSFIVPHDVERQYRVEISA